MPAKHFTMPPLPVQEGVEFRWCERFPDYAVGSDGSVWSRRRWNKWRKLQPGCNSGGYRATMLKQRSLSVSVKVATLVCEAFHGQRQSGLEVCHNDGVKTNDVPGNLRWATHLENIRDTIQHGTSARPCSVGERNRHAKLSESDVKRIRQLYPKYTQIELARIFRVAQPHIGLIVHRKAWKHVS